MVDRSLCISQSFIVSDINVLATLTTVHRGRRAITAEVLRRARSRIETWWSLGSSAQMRREAARLLRLLWRRRQARAALIVASHDAAEQIARSMAD